MVIKTCFFFKIQSVVFEKPGDAGICAAFLINNNTKIPTTVKFRGVDIYVPARSISILPDCKSVVFNSEIVNLNTLYLYL